MKIAISGLSSAGSTSTARAVSQKLGIPMSTYTLRDLAKDKGVDFEVIHHQAKKHDPSIDRDLDTHQINFLNTNQDAIVSSDLACWLDDPKIYESLGLEKPVIDLKIFLDVSVEERAKRFHEREQGKIERLKEYDDENFRHYQQVYGVDTYDVSHVDWIFKTDHMGLEEVVGEICQRITEIEQTKNN